MVCKYDGEVYANFAFMNKLWMINASTTNNDNNHEFMHLITLNKIIFKAWGIGLLTKFYNRFIFV